MHYDYEEFDRLRRNGFPEAAIKAHAENCHGDLSDFEACYIGIVDADSAIEAIAFFLEEWNEGANIGPHVRYIDWEAVASSDSLSHGLYAADVSDFPGAPTRTWAVFQ